MLWGCGQMQFLPRLLWRGSPFCSFLTRTSRLVHLWERIEPVTLTDLLIPECCRGRDVGFGDMGCGSVPGYIITIQDFRWFRTLSNGDSVCLTGLLEESERRPDSLMHCLPHPLSGATAQQPGSPGSVQSSSTSLPPLFTLGTVCVFAEPLR